MKVFLWFIGIGAIAVNGFAQDSLLCKTGNKDTTRLSTLFTKAKLEVNARTVYMTTINEGALTDDQAWAACGGIGIVTKSLHGLDAGISGQVIYNLWSTNLAQWDTAVMVPNRYEAGLFDIQNPHAKTTLTRLENLFVRYSLSKSTISVGRMKINTPFINPQDGRMNVTMVEGVWLNIAEFQKVTVSGGWIWAIAPRSSMQWHTVANSIGVYPSGVTESGAKSNYYGNLSACSGLGMANISYKPIPSLKVNVWDLFVDNIMNASLLEVNHESGKNTTFYQGIMYVHERAVNAGGHQDPAKTYIGKGSQANVISAQLGIKTKKVNTNVNYTAITGDGRYLMPREWGRDPFYTFMMRERNEGFGNVQAFANKTTFFFFKQRFKPSVGYGLFLLPDVKNTRLNKYGMPSYHQVNLDLAYSFNKFLKGTEIRCIAVYKLNEGETYGSKKYIYNKVNMLHLTVMMDYRF